MFSEKFHLLPLSYYIYCTIKNILCNYVKINLQKIPLSFNITDMEFTFIEDITDKRTFLNTGDHFINPLLAENNLDNFIGMKDFFRSEKFLLLVDGHMGTGKSVVTDYFLNYLVPETVVLKYNCFETTILDDMLLTFFEVFKELTAENIIQPPKNRSENFIQKINSYLLSITLPIVIVIDSFDMILKANKSEILEFLKQISQFGKIKVVICGRNFDLTDFEAFDFDKLTVGALEKHLFEKYLKSFDIKLIGPVSDELYKYTKGYYLYTALSVKIIQIRGLSLYEFLNGFSKSFLSYNDFILREALALIDPVSGHLFRFLTIIRHPVSINLLRAFRLYDEFKIKVFIDTLILAQDGNMIYLQDYYKTIAENSIPQNVAAKLHRSCVELYNTQLPLKPMERDLLISRATMRAEIEYHSMFLPKKPVLKPKEIAEINKEEIQVPSVEEQPAPKDITSIRFIFESEEEENDIMNKIADSINEFISFSDEQLKEIEKENNMTLVELINLAKQEENKFNFKRVVMIYQRALMMKNNSDYQIFLPTIFSKLADAYGKLSDWFNAVKYYKEALNLYEAAGDFAKSADIKLSIANIYYLTFKKEQAKEVLNEILTTEKLPSDIYIKTYIMLSDYTEDNPELSYSCLKKALENAENSEDEILLAELYYKFAAASDEIGETKQAVMFYKSCVEINRKGNEYISAAYSNLAGIYEENGIKDSAVKFYELSLQIDEENNNFNGIYLSSMKLAALNRKINPEKALKYYDYAYNTACRLNEIFYKVSSTLAAGDFYLMLKNPEKALEKYFRAKSLADGNLSENNLKKIEKRINDLSTQLGEEKFNQIKNGMSDDIK